MKKNAVGYYREIAVPPALTPWLECLWHWNDPSPKRETRTIYPDGRCELVVHLGQPLAWRDVDIGWAEQAPVLFAGQFTGPIRLAPRGPINCVGFRLRPAAGTAAMARLDTWRDCVADITPHAPELGQGLVAAAWGVAAEAAAETWSDPLAAHFSARPADQRMVEATATLELRSGQMRIAQLAEAAGLGLRQFQTRFSALVGLTPKQFARICRLQATLRALDLEDEPLADTALAAGFSDQAHATRELVRLTGHTPARLRQALQAGADDDEAINLAAAFIRGHS